MKRYIIVLNMLIFSLCLTFNAQTKRKQKSKSTSKKVETVVLAPEITSNTGSQKLPEESNWQEIINNQLKFKISFPGKALSKKSINTFEGKDTNEISYELETKRAFYSLNYFSVIAKPNNQKSYEQLYDRFDDSTLKMANSGMRGVTTKILSKKEIQIGDIPAREVVFEDINSSEMIIREVFKNGKFYYLYISTDPKISQEDKLIIENTKNKFFNSFQFLNK